MKRFLLVAAVVAGALATPALAYDVYHRGYVTRNGIYVAPHIQTSPDRNIWNNYSTRPNINPYTGRQGTVDPYRPRLNPYGYGYR